MLWNLIWIVGAIAFILCLKNVYRYYNGLEFVDFMIASLIGIVGSLLGLAIALSISCVIDGNADKTYIKTNEEPIYCINDTSSTNGQSFLFSGYIKEELVYRMFVEKDGGKKVVEVKAFNATVYEDSNNSIDTYTEYYTSDKVKWWLGDDKTNNKDQYKIHIPKGSITTEYKLDLK